jgi:secreted trypsin-like serine protease
MVNKKCVNCAVQSSRYDQHLAISIALTSVLCSIGMIADAQAQEVLSPSLIEYLTPTLPASIARQRQQSSQSRPNRRFDKILNGRDAKRGEFPWQVALVHADTPKSNPFDGFYCGGTLVAWKWVLTAAHCTYENNPVDRTLPPVEMSPATIQVYLGSHDFSGGERVAVQRIVRKSYDEKTQDNDIALLELASEPKRKKSVERVNLLAPNDAEPTSPGRYATSIGWGATANKDTSKILQVVDVQIKPSEICNKSYVDRLRARAKLIYKAQNKSDEEVQDIVDERFPRTMNLITSNMMCAGTDIRAADTCFGDSGGPLLVKRGGGYAQAGIVSWGPSEGCGLANLYGVYTQISHYIDWIVDQTK